MNAQHLKSLMDTVWESRGPASLKCSCITRWEVIGDHLEPRSGTPCHISPSAGVLAWRKKTFSGWDFPAWQKSQPRDIEPSAELKARYKEDCPRNYKGLIAAFGKTITKYDAGWGKNYVGLLG